MGFNIYKEIPKIKDWIKKTEGLENDIPTDILARALMMLFGMKKDTVRKWINYFEENNIIIIKGEKVNFL